MSKHSATAEELHPGSFVVRVNEQPVYRTADGERARVMAARLHRIFQEDPEPERIAPLYAQGRSFVYLPLAASREARNRKPSLILEFEAGEGEFPWLEAAVVAAGIVRALQRTGTRQRPAPPPLVPVPKVQNVVPVPPAPPVLESGAGPLYLFAPPAGPAPSVPEEIQRTLPVAGGRLVLYTKQGDLENLHARLHLGDAAYEVGQIGDRRSGQLARASMITLSNERVLRLYSMQGAGGEQTAYYRIAVGDVSELVTVAGDGIELDLNGDGQQEIVSTTNTPPMTRIYVRVGDLYLALDVNEYLNATAVEQSATDPSVFEATQAAPGAPRRRYRFTRERTFQLV